MKLKESKQKCSNCKKPLYYNDAFFQKVREITGKEWNDPKQDTITIRSKMDNLKISMYLPCSCKQDNEQDLVPKTALELDQIAVEKHMKLGNGSVELFKLLKSETIQKILQLLKNEKKDITRIAEAIKQTEANVSAQIKRMEAIGLVVSHFEPGEHGIRKICESVITKFIIEV